MYNFLRKITGILLRYFQIYFFLVRYRFNKQRNNILNYKKIESKLRVFSNSNFSGIDNGNVLIVVPKVNSDINLWRHSKGNIYYELFKSGMEHIPNVDFNIHFVETALDNWQNLLSERISELKPDFLIMNPETDPDNSGNWSIDEFVIRLNTEWKGKIIWLSLDSVLRTHYLRIDRLSKLRSGSILIAIDRKPKFKLRYFDRIIAPIFLPMSCETIQAIDDLPKSEIDNKYEISFLGTLYGYRKILINQLLTQEVKIAVNPQHSISRSVEYKYYLSELRNSKLTVNFSRNSRQSEMQLKSRILEAAIFGCFVATDENKIWREFFPDKIGIFYFKNVKALKLIIRQLDCLENQSQIREILKSHARDRINNLIWDAIR